MSVKEKNVYYSYFLFIKERKFVFKLFNLNVQFDKYKYI